MMVVFPLHRRYVRAAPIRCLSGTHSVYFDDVVPVAVRYQSGELVGKEFGGLAS